MLICPRCEARWFQHGTREPEPLGNDRQSWTATVSDGADRLGSDLAAMRAGAPRRLRGSSIAGGAMAIGLVACLAIAAFVERNAVVRTMPRTAALYRAVGLHVNARGLELLQVTARDEASGDVTVTGEIRNVAGHRVQIPRLSFDVRDRDGATVMSWSQNAPSNTLAAARTIGFASAPHRPPPEGRTVTVHFDASEPPPISAAGRSR